MNKHYTFGQWVAAILAVILLFVLYSATVMVGINIILTAFTTLHITFVQSVKLSVGITLLLSLFKVLNYTITFKK
jgi:hypothetical protein